MTKEITKGSIADIMQNSNVSLAESFLSCDCVVLFDVSGSMNSLDGHPKSGKFAIIQFADRVDFMPGGVPTMGMSGFGTDLTAALKYAKVADEIPDMRFVIISDGEPRNEITAKQTAAQYQNRIDTIFIGNENDRWNGQGFLSELAQMSGGKAVTTAAENIGKEVTLLLSERAVC